MSPGSGELGSMKRERRFLLLLLAVAFFACGGRLEAEVLVSQEEPASSPPEAAEEQAQAPADQASVEATEVLQIEVIAVEGDVRLKPADKASFIPAVGGALIETGTTIKTGTGSYVELGFDEEDQNIVRVEEETTAVLLLKEDEKVELLEGEVFSIIRRLPAGAAFEIRTPTAVAGARGTEWATRYKDETTDVEAYDETPYVKSFDTEGKAIGEAVAVAPGFATSIKRFQRPAAVRQISEARRQRWTQLKTNMQQRLHGARQRRGMPRRDPQKLRRFKVGTKQAGLDASKHKDLRDLKDVLPGQDCNSVKKDASESGKGRKRPLEGLQESLQDVRLKRTQKEKDAGVEDSSSQSVGSKQLQSQGTVSAARRLVR